MIQIGLNGADGTPSARSPKGTPIGRDTFAGCVRTASVQHVYESVRRDNGSRRCARPSSHEATALSDVSDRRHGFVIRRWWIRCDGTRRHPFFFFSVGIISSLLLFFLPLIVFLCRVTRSPIVWRQRRKEGRVTCNWIVIVKRCSTRNKDNVSTNWPDCDRTD